MTGENTGNRAGLTRLMQGTCGGKAWREKQTGDNGGKTLGNQKTKNPKIHYETITQSMTNYLLQLHEFSQQQSHFVENNF